MTFEIDVSLRNKSGIYYIYNSVDSRVYIGSTVDFWRRYTDHKNKLMSGTHGNKYLQSFVNKYGINTLSFKLKALCKNTCLLFNEKYYIDTIKPEFNIKSIVQRPYFPDIEEFYSKNVKDLMSSLMPDLAKAGEDYMIKYPPIEGLNFAENIEYYEGNYPSCKINKTFEIHEDMWIVRSINKNKSKFGITASKREKILNWARSKTNLK